jgi:hypothetical protein
MKSFILAFVLFSLVMPQAGASPGTEGCYDLQDYQEDLFNLLTQGQGEALDIWFDSDDITDIRERDLEDIADALYDWSEEALDIELTDVPQAALPFHIAFLDSLYIQYLYVYSYSWGGEPELERWENLYEASQDAVFASHETGYEYCGDLWTDVFPQYEEELS